MSSEIGTLYLNEITCVYKMLIYESSKTSKLEAAAFKNKNIAGYWLLCFSETLVHAS